MHFLASLIEMTSSTSGIAVRNVAFFIFHGIRKCVLGGQFGVVEIASIQAFFVPQCAVISKRPLQIPEDSLNFQLTRPAS